MENTKSRGSIPCGPLKRTLQALAQLGERPAFDLSDTFLGQSKSSANLGIRRLFLLPAKAEMRCQHIALAPAETRQKLFDFIALDEALGAADRPRIGQSRQR